MSFCQQAAKSKKLFGARMGKRLGFPSLTMVVSAMEPKLLMKMLQETLTGGPEEETGVTAADLELRSSNMHPTERLNRFQEGNLELQETIPEILKKRILWLMFTWRASAGAGLFFFLTFW